VSLYRSNCNALMCPLMCFLRDPSAVPSCCGHRYGATPWAGGNGAAAAGPAGHAATTWVWRATWDGQLWGPGEEGGMGAKGVCLVCGSTWD
jgi:hypothetical protein